jgi:hypothetical protein
MAVIYPGRHIPGKVHGTAGGLAGEDGAVQPVVARNGLFGNLRRVSNEEPHSRPDCRIASHKEVDWRCRAARQPIVLDGPRWCCRRIGGLLRRPKTRRRLRTRWEVAAYSVSVVGGDDSPSRDRGTTVAVEALWLASPLDCAGMIVNYT